MPVAFNDYKKLSSHLLLRLEISTGLFELFWSTKIDNSSYIFLIRVRLINFDEDDSHRIIRTFVLGPINRDGGLSSKWDRKSNT